MRPILRVDLHLYANLNDGDDTNDPYLIDVRAPEDFANGHIKGANNVDVKALFTAAELAKFPTDGQIVVNCYSGQTSAQVVAALRMLGLRRLQPALRYPELGRQRQGDLPVHRRAERQLPGRDRSRDPQR